MLKRRRWVLSLVVLLAAVSVLIAVLTRFYPRERLLMDRAVSLAEVRRWELDQGAHYYWLPDRTLLLLRYLSLGNGSESTYTAFRYDLASHQETPLPGLTAALAQDAKYPDSLQLSPDGKWLRWTDYPRISKSSGRSAFVQKVIVASLDGQHRTEWLLKDAYSYFWLSDSRRWLAVRADTHSNQNKARIYSLDDPKSVQILKIDPSVPLMYDRWINMSANILLLDECNWRDQSEVGEIVALRVGPQSLQPLSRHKVTLPPDAEIVHIVYSPQGDRIAWVLNIHSTPAFAAFLRRLLPSFSAPAQIAESLWVSRADGSEMHEVGHLPRQIDLDIPHIPMPPTGPAPSVLPQKISQQEAGNKWALEDSWQWMPDGKRISFVYKNTLYAVSAE